MLKKFIAALLFPTLLMAMPARSQEIVIYGSYGESYQFIMLQHVLNYFPEEKFTLKNFQGDAPKQRAFSFMAQGKGIDVIFGGSTIEREQRALPIRIPIFKGLNGWRIPLINKDKKGLFNQAQSIDEFRQFIPGQFHTWSDTKVLESNSIYVAKGSSYEGLFHMLDKNRIDYFPRSVLEIFHEYEAHKQLNITIEQNTLLHYPTAYYFYVSYNNKELAKIIELGLEKAIADGSFERIFMEHHGETINYIRKMNRKVFMLNNPFLPKETPIARKELWINFNPGDITIQ